MLARYYRVQRGSLVRGGPALTVTALPISAHMEAHNMDSIATIGYEATTMKSFLETLQEAGVDLLVDVRALANSRRPGFAKTRLAANLEAAGIEYLHLRGLGTPAEGRAAARAGRYDQLREIFLEHMQTPAAQDELAMLAELVCSGRRVCLMCLEADPAHCHRSMVASALEAVIPVQVDNLAPRIESD